MSNDPALAENPVIVALDGLELPRALALVELLHAHVWGFKLNDMLHHRDVQQIYDAAPDGRFFIDAKLHDIPNTVANTVRRLVERRPPDLLTVHASGGSKMIAAAVQAAAEASGGRTRVLAVTVLTSLDAGDCEAIYHRSPGAQVRTLATIAQAAGCFGVVCSPQELEIIAPLGIPAIVPGIRPAWTEAHGKPVADDQARIATAAAAIRAGATGLVIGRPIVHAPDPLDAVRLTLAETGSAR